MVVTPILRANGDAPEFPAITAALWLLQTFGKVEFLFPGFPQKRQPTIDAAQDFGFEY